MENQTIPTQQHLFRYQSFQINKSQLLGRGAHGTVYTAKCDQLPCAAKILHPTIFDPRDPGAERIMDRFRQECALLESIKHPNIVQYLGMNVDPESRLPVLLMELLNKNLTKMLERSQQSLAYYIQVDICHDVALAVAYLHSNNISHRDLSSNNVLIIAGRRAKVTDFGMSRLAGAAPTMTPLTMCPGTLSYMPPEALRVPPQYTKTLDCFSEGVIMIQVCTRLWPEPGPRTQIIQDSTSPTGIMEMPVPETERRKKHIDLIDPTHSVLPIAVDCLCFQEIERPSSEELCQRLAGLKESTKYIQSIEQQQDEIVEKNRQLQQYQEEIASRERQLRQLNQQLEEQEQATAELQRTNHSLQRQVEQQQQQLSQQYSQGEQQLPPSSQVQCEKNELKEELSNTLAPEQLQSSTHVNLKPSTTNTMTMSLNWRDGGKAPFHMSNGSAVVDGNVAYFMSWNGQGCSYSLTSKKWTEFHKYPFCRCSLAVINGQLTGIGGTWCSDDQLYNGRNDLLIICHKCEKWEKIFPSMPTRRRATMAITTKDHLIVAGGIGGFFSSHLKTVEVMDTKILVWSKVASLPHPYNRASATICGDHLYMVGGKHTKAITKSVLICSLTELLQSSSSSALVWHIVPDAQAVYLSTCATVNGHLLAVGGCDKLFEATAAIHKHNPTTNSWDLVGDMPTARYDCLVAVFPNNELMVVGGRDGGSDLDTVEFTTFYS